jgi:cytochrome P450
MVYTPVNHPDHEKTLVGLHYFQKRVAEEIELRRQEPKDDLLTLFATGTIGGEPLSDETIQSFSMNILAGGVDTTTALTSNALIHLARHPQDRQRLIDDPALLPVACEEFLRYFSPIHALSRTAYADVVVNGWEIKKGERVLLAYAAGNRDPEAFDDPETVKLDRLPNKHVAFGAGMHRCLGSFLARMMFQEMITAVFERMPDYELVEDGMRSYPSIGSVNGWIAIPARFPPGLKVGAVIA